ncbi:BLUF domain-containing protein [Mucilaginibacter polytrichastri]|uniref:BLUF domain-containing protein n=1 Tax=Mucilaginibacter polytrichastri TaxID=1302689 RepID=A0A1Q5ZXC8_9SPHI|nr:BLUF domain-containing protein [Mucilaginibacter polytrichastri]OKS86392.1 hypothetical protein RG47T_1848 [Mucilaginibacter polytrichastri]SFT20733.1 Sensors of blue-light using FAD [Mucilaginibacter polytrichastri]
MLYNLIYISKAAKLMDNDDLKLIINESNQWNERHEITGMLLYIEGQFSKTGGRFIQVLEGSRDEVQIVFNMIKNDARHCNILLMNECELEKRNFSSWLMGFKSITENEFIETVGYFDLDDFSLIKTKSKDFNIPLNYLKSFYEIHTDKNTHNL